MNPAMGEPARSRVRLWSFRIISAVLVPLLLLVLIEAGLRIAGYGFATGFIRPCTVQGRSAFCDNPRFTEQFFPPGMAREVSNHFSIPAEKPPGTFRIFILGESAAEGDPAPPFGFGRYLEVMLRDRFPAVKFEVINTAATAINSHVLLPIAKDVARHRGDLFLLYIGNNEVVGLYGPGTVLTSPASSLPLVRAGIFVKSTRLGQLLRAVLRSRGKAQAAQQWRGMEMFLKQQVPADSPALARVYENFQSNLRDIIDVARGAGARVLVSTVAINLKDSAPFASLHRPDVTRDELRAWVAHYQAGIAFDAAGECTEALPLYLSAEVIDDRYADLQFRIARCQWKLGDFAPARERFVRARDLDALRFRADSRINAIIRSVASAAGVDLVDSAAAFADASPRGVPGRELFYEHVHMSPRGNYLLARTLFPRIADLLPEESRRNAAAGGLLSQAECERRLVLTSHDRRRVARAIIQRMSSPPFTNQLNHAEQVTEMQREADAPIDTFEQAAAEYRSAIARNPDDRWLHFDYGLLLQDVRDLKGAAEQFRLAKIPPQ